MPAGRTERWRDVPGFEGRYEVSDLGRVRSLARVIAGPVPRKQQTRVLKEHGEDAGYKRVVLCWDGKRVDATLSRLVMSAFVGPVSDHLEVDHVNGRKDDNRLENLEVVTESENVRRALRNGQRVAPKGEDVWSSVLTEEQVAEIRSLYALGWSQEKLAKRFGTGVHEVVTGKTWKHLPAIVERRNRPLVRGESVNTAKLTAAQVKALRKLYRSGTWTFAALGRKFGITYQSAADIVRRKSWAHVP